MSDSETSVAYALKGKISLPSSDGAAAERERRATSGAVYECLTALKEPASMWCGRTAAAPARRRLRPPTCSPPPSPRPTSTHFAFFRLLRSLVHGLALTAPLVARRSRSDRRCGRSPSSSSARARTASWARGRRRGRLNSLLVGRAGGLIFYQGRGVRAALT